jgi:hypothetical protein
VLHDREYRVRAWKVSHAELVLRGAVRDQKPPGLYTPEDVRPLTIHHMQVELRVRFPSMEIVGADVLFETHPHMSCPRITDHYGELVGCRSPAASTTRCASCSAGHAVARTRRRC